MAKTRSPQRILGKHLDILQMLKGRRVLFSSTRGILGHAPFSTTLNDYVAILNRCPEPLILRHDSQHGSYRVVGKCYVDGFMMGEVKEEVEKGNLKIERIKIG
ncbi:Hypothetical predicted protein [Lecanosticta acicola]|uniref:Uncharacterized protein n=1 Tax=Lecanosticta acicola TaxID=111012 RepID=A0AAI8Z825_9PEZI|nr:Hypothetical predicted protein [Lecanosticta acicola]